MRARVCVRHTLTRPCVCVCVCVLLTGAGLGLPGGQDTTFAAAFVAHTALAIQAIPNLEILSFWTFTDVSSTPGCMCAVLGVLNGVWAQVFEEGGFDSVPYHEGYGIQTYNGVPKVIRGRTPA